MPEIILSDRARRDLVRLTRSYRDAAVGAIDRLSTEPLAGKALRGELEGYRSLRIGSYRIGYAFDRRRDRVEVVWIRHRREAYR